MPTGCEALPAAGEKCQSYSEASGVLQVFAERRILVHENAAVGKHE